MSAGNIKNAEKIDVGYVARLARLDLDEGELGKFQLQLEQILKYVDKIQELDLDLVEPTSHSLSFNNIFRDDGAIPGLDCNDVMKNAPQSDDNQFSVPKIVE